MMLILRDSRVQPVRHPVFLFVRQFVLFFPKVTPLKQMLSVVSVHVASRVYFRLSDATVYFFFKQEMKQKSILNKLAN